MTRGGSLTYELSRNRGPPRSIPGGVARALHGIGRVLEEHYGRTGEGIVALTSAHENLPRFELNDWYLTELLEEHQQADELVEHLRGRRPLDNSRQHHLFHTLQAIDPGAGALDEVGGPS